MSRTTSCLRSTIQTAAFPKGVAVETSSSPATTIEPSGAMSNEGVWLVAATRDSPAVVSKWADGPACAEDPDDS